MAIVLGTAKPVPANFIKKTYQLVDDPSTDHIVSWGEDYTTFIIWRLPEFCHDILLKYFNHDNFSSFHRQLNTYGFRKRKIDRWEFKNEFFRKGEKHLLCEIHRRKKSLLAQVAASNHQHNHPCIGGDGFPGFFSFTGQAKISPSHSDDQVNWFESSPIAARGSSVTALSQENHRLRQTNSMLRFELAHMKKLYKKLYNDYNDMMQKLYNDMVQNHVRPVSPSTPYPSSLIISTPTVVTNIACSSPATVQKPLHRLLGFHQTQPKLAHVENLFNSTTVTSRSSLTMVEEPNNSGCNQPKLFGIPLQSRKRLHPEPSSPPRNAEIQRPRFLARKEDLNLNLLPPPCS